MLFSLDLLLYRWEFFEATSGLFLFGCDSLDLKKNLFTILSKFINNCKLNVLFYNWDSFYGTLQIWCRPISLIIQGCSMVLYSIWPRNHTSHKKFYFNEFVANVLRDVIGIVHRQPICLGWQAILLSKMAPVEVGVWLPWWCPALVLPAPGSWGLV